MATITGLTADRMLEIEGASVVSGTVDVNNLILTKRDGSTINAGSVRGPIGPAGELWFSGAGVPLNSTGKIGDRWLNEVNGDHYEKTADTTWTLRGNLMPGRPTILTALPAVTSADHGREVYLRVDEAGAYGGPYLWLCKYMHYKADGVTLNPNTYKWDVIDAIPLRHAVGNTPDSSGAADQTAATAFTDLGVVGPSITVPFAGDYDVELAAAGNGADNPVMSFAVGATAASLADALWLAKGATWNTARSRRMRKTGIAASTALVSKYRAWTAVTVSFATRSMLLYPVRIG